MCSASYFTSVRFSLFFFIYYTHFLQYSKGHTVVQKEIVREQSDQLRKAQSQTEQHPALPSYVAARRHPALYR